MNAVSKFGPLASSLRFFTPDTRLNTFFRSFDISPDGQRFLMMKDARSTDDDPYAGLAQMIVVQNWFQELNARVPVE